MKKIWWWFIPIIIWLVGTILLEIVNKSSGGSYAGYSFYILLVGFTIYSYYQIIKGETNKKAVGYYFLFNIIQVAVPVLLEIVYLFYQGIGDDMGWEIAGILGFIIIYSIVLFLVNLIVLIIHLARKQ